MPEFNPSPEHRLSLTTNPGDPQMTALQTLAVACVFGIELEYTANGVTLPDDHELAGEPLWEVLREQVAAHAHEIQDALIHATCWRYESELLELATMPYRQYLKSDAWRETRARAVAEAGGRCQVCNADSRLHVHHRTYERRGLEQSLDLIVLCADCHGLFHKHGRLK